MKPWAPLAGGGLVPSPRDPAPAPAGRVRPRAEAVRAALNAVVFANTPPIEILVNPVAVGLILTLLGDLAPAWARLCFFAASLVVVVVNSSIWFAYRADRRRDERPRWWHGWLVAGAALNGVVWGLGTVAVFPLAEPTFVAAVVPVVLAGFVGGYVAGQSASLPSVVAYTVPALTPLALCLAVGGDATGRTIAAGMGLYGTLLMLFAFNAYHHFESAIVARLDKADLIAELAATSARVARITDSLPGAVVEGKVSDAGGPSRIVYASSGFEALFGFPAAAAMDDIRLLTGRMEAENRTHLHETFRSPEHGVRPFTTVVRYLHPDRGEIWIELRGRVERHADDHVHWYAFARDYTEDRHREERLRHLARVYETTSDGALVADAHFRVLTANAALLRLAGVDEAAVVGWPVWQLARLAGVQGRFSQIRRALAETGSWRDEVAIGSAGAVATVILSANLVRDAEGRIDGLVAVFSDISRQKAVERTLVELADRDALTGLPNRRSLDRRIEAAIAGAAACGEGVAVHFVDLNDFKRVNDTHGHAAGDAILAAVAARLATLAGGDAVAFRFGGDEFLLLQPSVCRPEAAAAFARRLVSGLAGPVQTEAMTVAVGASVGTALYPEDGDTAATLVAVADRRAYAAKPPSGGRRNG